ncbi:MAG: succinate dehydrogenase, hydrophobic membrane anchor protein [Rickettsiales bacterium]|nr:succinate dehydrogenase, hydrophobic membrane anchor protein [Rickettsiales bacterium]
MSNSDELRSPLANVRGLGSAKDGTEHWWMQRVTALVLIPTTIWFMCSLICKIIGQDHMAVVEWFNSPAVAATMLVLVTAMFYHAKLGLQVVIEDYVHKTCSKKFLLLLISIGFPVLTAISWLSIVKLHLLGF